MDEKQEELDASLLAIEEAEADIRMFEKYKRLAENKDFQDVIMYGYLQGYTTDLFQELVNGTYSTRDEMEMHMRKIEAIGAFADYVDGLREKAEIAKVRIERERKFMAEKEEE